MPLDSTGTSGVISSRRHECEESLKRLMGGKIDAGAIDRLRRTFGASLADRIVGAAALQTKAQKKFGPGVWWATRRSLEQATAWQVAQLKATWFGDRLVYDLCCGIGGDATQLAKRSQLVAVDADAMLAEMAALNLQQCVAGSEPARVECGDATMIAVPHDAAIHIDPDRRAGDRRITAPDSYQPSWPQVEQIVSSSPSAVVKLAAAAKIDGIRTAQAHRCWISLQGTVREQSLLCGEAIDRADLKPKTRSAVSLNANGADRWYVPSIRDPLSVRAETSAGPLAILIDPDASIRAAGLTESFAVEHGLRLTHDAAGYLTCDREVKLSADVASMAVVGHVMWAGPCDDRKLRREFRSRNVHPVTIKVRGTDHDPAPLVKRYRKCGERGVTLWIGRRASRVFAAITE